MVRREDEKKLSVVKRNKDHSIWQHFTVVQGSRFPTIYICKYCESKVPYKSIWSLIYHNCSKPDKHY